MIYSVKAGLRWRPSKIRLTCFKVIARRFLLSHKRKPRKRLSQDNTAKVQDHILADRRLQIREIFETVVLKITHYSKPV